LRGRPSATPAARSPPGRSVDRMQVDLLVDPFGARWPEVRDTARAAVEAGFSGIWTWDHLDGHVFGEAHVLECWTLLTAIAVTVPDVMIGPLVLNVANRHPGVLAVMAATLQAVSGGRLLLGLGAGGGPDTPYLREQEAIGRTVPPDPVRRTQVETCVAQIHDLWRRPGFLEPRPAAPVVIGAFGPKMAELAGRVGDGINTRASHPQLPELVALARAAHERAGRDPARFLVTTFAGFDERWLTVDSPIRRRVDPLGVDRLILLVRPADDLARIADVGHKHLLEP
jgi:alkanesulfonate monooxygenase SsuD/methylene tetrahydromethanopterin reductase-like flavin-dependent oxidoreductase (luciferase family)